MESLGEFSAIVTVFLIIVAILAFLMPFFVLRIRNEMIKLNEKMTKVIELLGGKDITPKSEYSPASGKKIKRCPHCDAKNREEDFTCINCGKVLV